MLDGKLCELTSNIGDMALKRRVRKIITDLAIEPSDNILDCGCGDGLYLSVIKGLGKYKVFGFDLNKRSLALAQGAMNVSGIPLVQGSICSLPFKDRMFDKIFCSEVLEHVPDDGMALSEIHRVLKDNGRLAITVPNHNYPFLWDPLNWLMEAVTDRHIKSGFWAGIWNMHLRLYYPEQIEDAVKKAGFKVTSIEPLTHYCVPFNHIVLYGLKKVLDSGILPEAMRNTANKFSSNNGRQSRLIKLGYKALSLMDRLNDRLPEDKSSVAILVNAVKE